MSEWVCACVLELGIAGSGGGSDRGDNCSHDNGSSDSSGSGGSSDLSNRGDNCSRDNGSSDSYGRGSGSGGSC